MSERERFQAMILDHIYGLLEPAEAQELEAYLASAEGATLREQSDLWKRQISAVAKTEYPEVQFSAPRPAEVKPQPASKPQPVAPRATVKPNKKVPAAKKGFQLGWAIAASLLILAVGFGVPIINNAINQRDAEADLGGKQAALLKADKAQKDYVAQVQKRTDDVTKEINAAHKEQDELEGQFAKSLEEARKAIEDKQFYIRLTGPERAQPGAPNEWEIRTIRQNGVRATPQKIEMVVKDQTGTVLFKDEKKAETKGAFLEPPKLSLPVSFWEKVKPETEIFLDVTAYTETNTRSKLCEKIQLARPVYSTQLVTDKPMYKPGDTLYYRSLTLDRSGFLPPERDMRLTFTLTKPNGEKVPLLSGIGQLVKDPEHHPDHRVLGADKKPIRGIGCGEFVFPTDPGSFPGGEYTLTVSETLNVFDEVQQREIPKPVELATRKVMLNEYKPELFEKKLEFDGKSYGAGDTVMVRVEASNAQGKLKGARVDSYATVDGQLIQIPAATTDDQGVARFKFKLPRNISKGEGSLSVTFSHNTGTEPMVRNIPLVGRELAIEFFPEGGDLVEGVPARVYFQAKLPSGKPADIQGILTDGKDTIAEIATVTDANLPGVNRGQGSFTFTPQPGRKYFVKLNKPSSIIAPKVTLPQTVASGIGLANLAGCAILTSPVTTGFELPKIKADGVVLTALNPVSKQDEPMRFRLGTGKGTKTVLVGAYARGRLLDHQRATIESGKSVEVKLNPSSTLGGVTRITVFEEKAEGEGRAELLPVAERLVYRKPGEQLMLNANSNPDKARFFPGSNVSLDIRAFDEKEKSVPAIVMVAVVNQSVIAMADEKNARLLPTHFLLASEVNKPEDLEHADFLLYDPNADRTSGIAQEEREKKYVKASESLDRLLGTQGWRRFAEQNLNTPRQQHDKEVDRLLVANGQKTRPTIQTLRQEEERVKAEFQPKLEVSSTRVLQAEEDDAKLRNDAGDIVKQNKLLASEKEQSDRDYHAMAGFLEDLKEKQRRALNWSLPAICVSLVLIACVCAVVALRRTGKQAIPYYASALGTFGLGACVLVMVMLTNPNEPRQLVSTGKYVLPDEVMMAVQPLPQPEVELAANEGMAVPGGMQFDMPRAAAFPGGFGGGGRGGPMKADGKFPPMPAPMLGGPRPMNMAPAMAPAVPGVMKAMDERADLKGKADGMHMQEEKAKRMLAGRDANFKGNKQAAEQNKPGEFRRAEAQMQNRFRDMEALRKKRADKDMAANGKKALREIDQGARFDDLEQQLADPGLRVPFVVREYRHEKVAGQGDVRNDFTETVYWHPALVLPESGQAEIHFALSDDIARYQVLVAGHTLDGRIGATTTTIEARKPFSVNPKTPIEVTASDRIDMPISALNDSDDRRVVTFIVTPTGLKAVDESLLKNGNMQDSLDLAPNKGGRKIMSFRADRIGEAMVRVLGTSDPMATQDEIERKFRVVSDGFPISGSFSDLLEGGKSAPGTIMLPKDFIPGTLKVSLNVYPTTLSDMISGLEGLLREPGGCFEQTSTSNYPNLLILDYLKTSDQAKPEVAQRAREMLDRGYNKLVAYECPDSPNKTRQGFEWFGRTDQQHEALTAYGLLQFKDLAKVYDKVDKTMIQRTQQYLMSKRDGNGGFNRNQTAIDSFGRAPKHITDAYIAWALTSSDPDDKEGMDLTKELAALKMQSKQMIDDKKADTYFLALVANTLLNRPAGANRLLAIEILKFIAKEHQKDGFVDGPPNMTSITCSGGRDLQIETTALAVLGWIRANDKPVFGQALTKATKWLCQQRDGGGAFGSTQSTILALKALIAEANSKKSIPEGGEFTLIVGDKKFKKTFTQFDTEVITLELPNVEKVFQPGANEVRVEITSKQQYPFSLQWSCNTTTPVSGDKCAVELTTKLNRAKATEGDTVALNVSLKNKLDKAHGMTVAIVGIPGGMKIPTDMKQLKELKENGKIGYFEIKGRELVLYWRAMKDNEQIDLTLDLICETPGEYRGPASRGYLYYNADQKHWIDPLKIEIAPRDLE